MSDKAGLVFMVGLGILMSLAALIFTLWLIVAILVDFILHFRSRDQLDRWRQFQVPHNLRDYK